MPFLSALKECAGSDFSEALVERFGSTLDALAARNARRFSAGAISRDTDTSREDSARLLALGVEAGILSAAYEVECPVCGRLLKTYPDESFTLQEVLQCAQPGCEVEFPPDRAVVRVLFDFVDAPRVGGIASAGPEDEGGGAATIDEMRGAHERYEMPCCPNDELCRRLDAVLTAAPKAKGDALEDFVEYAFACYPRLFRDEGKRRRYLERDRVITIRPVPATLVASWGSLELVVDCRNRGGRYDSDDVNSFVGRMRESKSNLGLIIAVAGFTKGQVASAEGVLKQAWDADHMAIGVISRPELEQLCAAGARAHWLDIVHESVVAARHGRRYRSPLSSK